MVFLKEFFAKLDFENNQQRTKEHAELPHRQRVHSLPAECHLQTVWTQIRPDKMSGLIWIQLFDTLMVFLKEFLKKIELENNQQTTKEHAKLPSRQRVHSLPTECCLLITFTNSFDPDIRPDKMPGLI